MNSNIEKIGTVKKKVINVLSKEEMMFKNNLDILDIHNIMIKSS